MTKLPRMLHSHRCRSDGRDDPHRRTQREDGDASGRGLFRYAAGELWRYRLATMGRANPRCR